MNIKNIEELRTRIHNSKHLPTYSGLVCVGYGRKFPDMDDYFGLRLEDIHAISDARREVFPSPNWCGTNVNKLYYVTEKFYNNHIKEKEEAKPRKTMTSKELYQKQAKGYYELMGIKEGSRVKVTHSVESCLNGWPSAWVTAMNRYVGNEYTVDSISNGEVELGGYVFPFFVVFPVVNTIKLPDNIRISKDYVAKFNEKGEAIIGCQTIPHETIKAVYEASQSVMDQLK